ncbi:MAG: ferredoxin [Saprospiraceae bacterium]|jgi:ferredoxin|nr:ferredoxin [Saprospiraceae bacterium]MCA0333270.1 ferredoxin [Bacteroidota bacterium]MCB0604837.1 ferredoxin [Saprospiraceae bacterium]MCO5277643.1 ferredoxin [Saprospiraceae bacterium]HMT76203.1 ferredoxin [Saprospiraceae bacterium]
MQKKVKNIMAKLVHYREKCIGCGVCHEMQPEYWRMSKKDGKANLVKAKEKKGVYIVEIGNNDIELSNLVVAACPVRVIKVNE